MWKACLSTLGADGQKQFSPATSHLIAVARHSPLSFSPWKRSLPLDNSAPCSVSLARRVQYQGSFSRHHICCCQILILFIHYFVSVPCYNLPSGKLGFYNFSQSQVFAQVNALQVPNHVKSGSGQIFWLYGFWNLYQCLSAFHWMHRCQRLLLSPLAYDAIFQNTHKGALTCECVSIHCLKRRNILCHDDADSTPC